MLNLLTTNEQVIPFAAQGDFQSRESRQAWEIFASLNALNIARACANLLRENFLRQTPLLPQCGYIPAKPRSGRASFWLARWHRQMLAEMQVLKHEALHRASVFSNLVRRSKSIVTFLFLAFARGYVKNGVKQE